MRTPWRFLSDLVTRKPTDDQVDDLQNELKAVEPQELPTADQTTDLESETVEPSADDSITGIAPVTEDEASISQAAEHDIDPSDDRAAAVGKPVAVEGEMVDGASRLEIINVPEVANSDELTASRAKLEGPSKASEPKPAVTPKTTRSRRIAVKPAVQDAEAGGPDVVGVKTFLEEMATLDVEIAGLRRQLSEKLILQNEQLRKMAQRFDRT